MPFLTLKDLLKEKFLLRKRRKRLCDEGGWSGVYVGAVSELHDE
jgi:hypothetical protein